MGLLVPARRAYRGWRKVLPLYDGRECPDCGAVIIGREGRELHRSYHLWLANWQDTTTAALRTISRHVGLAVEEYNQAGADDYARVDLTVPAYDE